MPSRNDFLVQVVEYFAAFIFRTFSRNAICAALLSTGTSFTAPANCFSPRNRSRTSAALSGTRELQITYRSAARAVAHPTHSSAARRSFAELLNISGVPVCDRSEADRILEQCFVVAPDDAVGETGLGELQLERRHQIYVETQAQGLAVVGAPVGLRGEETVRLLECAPLVTCVRC